MTPSDVGGLIWAVTRHGGVEPSQNYLLWTLLEGQQAVEAAQGRAQTAKQ